MGLTLVSSVYYVSASLRQSVLSLLVIVFDRDITLGGASSIWDSALMTQGTGEGSAG